MKYLLNTFFAGIVAGAILSFLAIALYSPGNEIRDETIFVYGTLTNPVIRMYACWCLTESQTAVLAGYSKIGLNIVPNEEDVVVGKLITVSPTELARIDRYEDTPDNYQRELIELNGEFVWVYQK
jgi:gamma-glutamylcyclotransferase (GGCT)/AIG2-like uncharacterized protein YtfP